MKPTLEVIIEADGKISIDAVGFHGADCEAASKFLEAALGQVRERTHKPERHSFPQSSTYAEGRAMSAVTLRFDPDGRVHCLYSEVIDLQKLGVLALRRATQIEFNHSTQQWEVRDAEDASPRFTHRSRIECLAWEQQHLNP